MRINLAGKSITRFVGAATGWSAKRFVRAAWRCRTVQIRVGEDTVTAEGPLPPGLRDALAPVQLTSCALAWPESG